MSELTAWERIELIRHKNRPTLNDYIPLIFDEFYEMHGDRYFGDDPAIMGGIGRLNGIPVTVIGQVKGRDLEENKKTNFASPNPEGYRKALRLAKQAEKFHRPVICFIDTPGAFCGVAVALMAFSYSFWYSSQCSRSFKSPAENFQFFASSSMRSRKRFFCSFFETFRKIFTTR